MEQLSPLATTGEATALRHLSTITREKPPLAETREKAATAMKTQHSQKKKKKKDCVDSFLFVQVSLTLPFHTLLTQLDWSFPFIFLYIMPSVSQTVYN